MNITEIDELEKLYSTKNGIIFSPGKFEGEPIYVPYFWEILLNGCYSDDDEYDENDILISSIISIDEIDKRFFPELEGYSKIVLWESDQGFVYHRLEK